jgi:hypothetical protein
VTSRRGFLKLLVACGAAATLPEAVALARPPKPVPKPAAPPGPLFSGEIGRYEGFTIYHSPVFERRERADDYGRHRSMAVFVVVDGQRYGKAAALHIDSYNALGVKGRERVWKVLERKVELASKEARRVG